GSPDDEIAGEKSDSAFPAKENVETEAGFLGGQEETGKNGGQAGESSHHDFSEEQETHSKTDTLSEESERQAEPSPGPPSEVPKGTSGINDGKPQVSTEATTGPPHGRAGEEPGGERSEDASQHDMGSENQGAQNKTDGGAKSQEDGAGSSGSPSEKSAETAAIGAEKPDYSQTGNLNGKGSGVLSGTPGEESKAPGSKGAGEVAAREKGAGEEEQLPQGANSSRPESPTEEIAPKGPGFLQDKAGSNTLGGSPGKGEGNGKNLSQGALEEGEKSEGTEEGARKGEKHPGSQENEKNHSFGKNGSEEVKLSNESEKEGSPITFGEENLLSKTTGEELETQIIQFNGNLEEFATSPAFLKAIAQKYNISYKIPSGEFEMGYDGYPDSTPRHRVKIDTGFIMSKFPVTNLQFLQFVKEKGYTTSVEKKITSGISAKGGRKKIFDKHNRVIGYEDRNVSLVMDSSASFRNPFGRESNIADKYGHPVTQITWHDAVAYCAWLSGSTGKTFRLPTEAEWEFVTTNGGEISPDLFIEEQVELLSERSNFLDSLVGDTTPVDFYPDNKTTDGVCDMLGNVLEWTCDPFTQYPGSKKTDSLSADFKVTRGFGFIDPKTKANFWIRRPVKPMTAASYIGFRVVCEQN
ncbi:MAG: SUMF1/EgtB/PvdO family nonheme iron enzyme, partial [Nitrospinota bacterium]